MELRLNETLAEAKRHYHSFVDIRNQYNNFIEGRINLMVEHIKKGDASSTKSQSIKVQKLNADLQQTLKVNLEAQEQMMIESNEQQTKSYEKVSDYLTSLIIYRS